MRNTVIAARRDGLGERLNSIFNGLLISEITGSEFKFHWPKTLNVKNSLHVMDSVDRVFSKDFIDKYHICDSADLMNYKEIKFIKGDLGQTVNHIKLEIALGACLVSQKSLIDLIKTEIEEKRDLVGKVYAKIGFSDEILLARRFANQINIPNNLAAVHIRSGDIVYQGTVLSHLMSKAVCTPLISKLIQLLIAENKAVILFGQEPETISKFSSHYRVIDARAYYAGKEFSKLQEAMIDIFLMCRCKSIYAPSSGFSRIASQLAVIPIISIAKVIPKESYGVVVEKEIFAYPDYFSGEQKAYAYFTAFSGLYGKASFEVLDGYIKKARHYNPESVMYIFLDAINLHEHDRYVECEKILAELFGGLDISSYDKYEGSSVMEMISRRGGVGKVRREAFVFENYYKPFLKADNDSSFFYASTLRGYFKGLYDERALYDRLKSGSYEKSEINISSKKIYKFRATSNDDLCRFFERVRPAPISEGLIRIGRKGDGGYLVPNNLSGVEACFSPGVSKVATFEENLTMYGIKSYMADYSVEKPPVDHDMFYFEKKYLGNVNDDIYMRLEDWVSRNAINVHADYILQMDIEGGEYPVIFDTPVSVFKKFRIMVIEFHNMSMLFNRDAFIFLKDVFYKLLREFSVVHIHPNNCCAVISNDKYDVPNVIEFTFYRSDCVNHITSELSFPHPLDSPNVPGKPDIVLPKCWW